MEKLIHTIDKKGTDIIVRNKINLSNQPVLIKLDPVVRQTPVLLPKRPIPQMGRRTKK